MRFWAICTDTMRCVTKRGWRKRGWSNLQPRPKAAERSWFAHFIGTGWGAVATISLMLGLVCLLLMWGRHGNPGLVPSAQAALVFPGIGLVASGAAFFVRGRHRREATAVFALGVAALGGGLMYMLRPRDSFALLLLPIGVVLLAYAGWLAFTAAGRSKHEWYIACAGGVLLGSSAIMAGFGWF